MLDESDLENEHASVFGDNLAFSNTDSVFPLCVFQALHSGMSVDRIHQLTAIDKWFLHKLHRITQLEQHLINYRR